MESLEIFSEFRFPLLLQPLLARVELFSIWSFLLVTIVLRIITGASNKKAVLVTATYWTACILAATGMYALVWSFM